ncbi:kinase [Dorcoceras hygrometricum]|uniref:Kinase n=1 Tax=Dorcoceras hygrometricum TaxID=472368 RepID=A0A2Z7AGD2_9LAMI|nr:kinase [Dorcoceras hygrometricum]
MIGERSIPVVDLIDGSTATYREEPAFLSTTCSTETYKTSGNEAQKTAAGSYELHQRYPTSLTQQKALNKLKGRIYTYPKKLGAKSDAYANRLHKGDVFAHLTSFKKTSKSNIQTKRLSKRSPTLPLSLQSELSTVDNRRR